MQALLAGPSSDLIMEALVSIAFYEPDWRWAQERCLGAARSPNPAIRGVAATCLGHVARIHRTMDLALVRPVLDGLLNDPVCRPYAFATMEDIEMFVNEGIGDLRP